MMRRPCRLSLLVSCALLLAAPATAVTWLITPDGLGDAPTIQAGIDSASAGDEVVLADGTFTGAGNRDLDFLGKAIVVRSENGDPAACVIDCEGTETDPHRGILFQSSEGNTSVVQDLTIRGGYAPPIPAPGGGGIYCAAGCSPTLSGCVLDGNFAEDGGGLYGVGASPSIEGCVFSGNSTTYLGGGVFLTETSGDITASRFESNSAGSGGGAYVTGSAAVADCEFVGNTAAVVAGGLGFASTGTLSGSLFRGNEGTFGGGLEGSLEELTVESCVFFENIAEFGGAILFAHSTPSATVTSCTLASNSAAAGGGIFVLGGTDLALTNTIIAFSPSGEAVACFSEETTMNVSCTDIFGNAGGDWVGCISEEGSQNDNFSADPLFCDLPGGDLTVNDTSPCLPGPGNPCLEIVGALGSGCGGAVGAESHVDLLSWGRIKALYRN